MKTAAFVIGISAVVLYTLSYMQTRRRTIVALNLASRVLYVLQYVLLGAFEGAALDVCGAVTAGAARWSEKPFMKRLRLVLMIGLGAVTVAVGILLYKNVFSLLPLVGILLQSGALWLGRERDIRIVSILGCPFWFAYNVISGAYGSCIGDCLAFVALGSSIIRYDVIGKNKEKHRADAAK